MQILLHCCDYKAIRQLLGAFNSLLRESLSTYVDNNFTENIIYQHSKKERKLNLLNC